MRYSSRHSTSILRLGIELIFLSSFLVSFLLVSLLLLKSERKELPEYQLVNKQPRRQIYRLLHSMLTCSTKDPRYFTSAIFSNLLLKDIFILRGAEHFYNNREYDECLHSLNIFSGTHPFLLARKNRLQLKCLFFQKNYPKIISLTKQELGDDSGAQIILAAAHWRTGDRIACQQIFSQQFQHCSLEEFSPWFSGNDILSLLKIMTYEEWFTKLASLLDNQKNEEFLLEAKLANFPQLVSLFHAEYYYQRKDYDRTLLYLTRVLDSRLVPHKEKIRFKIDLRQNRFDNLNARLSGFQSYQNLYPRLLLDTASILLNGGQYEESLRLYSEYLKLCSPLEEKYWKTLWSLSWLNFRLGYREQSMKMFSEGRQSPFTTYQAAFQYWYMKMKGLDNWDFRLFPFTFYAVKQSKDFQSFRYLNQEFWNTFQNSPSTQLEKMLPLVSLLLSYGLVPEIFELLEWARNSLLSEPGDYRLLGMIKCIVQFRLGKYQQSFVTFRSVFPDYQSFRMPDFLAAICFPCRYLDIIYAEVQKNNVDPFLIMALIREESFFNPNAVSPAKACGLMQLLPKTARLLPFWQSSNLSQGDLFDPAMNIRLGLEYFQLLMSKYRDNVSFALAAYNAGTENVDTWIQNSSQFSDEEFIEMIPFTETRNYVKNILRNKFFYQYYYGSR